MASVGHQLSLNAAEVLGVWADLRNSQVWDRELLAFIHALRPQYKTGVISNIDTGGRKRWQSHVNADCFDVIVLSAEEGVEKPDPEIFLRALTRLGVAAEETIFVDDQLRIAEGAGAVGMHAILYTDSLDIRD